MAYFGFMDDVVFVHNELSLYGAWWLRGRTLEVTHQGSALRAKS